MVFELAEVINPEPDLPEFGKDRRNEEERQSQYVILVKGSKRQKRPVIEEVIEADQEVEQEPEQKFTISLDKEKGFTGLPAQL